MKESFTPVGFSGISQVQCLFNSVYKINLSVDDTRRRAVMSTAVLIDVSPKAIKKRLVTRNVT